MAEDSDQRTEAPSGKRLAEARQKGQVAMSREVNTWIVLAAAGAVVVLVAPMVMERIALILRSFIAVPDQMATDRGAIAAILLNTFSTVGIVIAVPLAVMFLASVAGPLLQAGLIFTLEPLVPDLSRLSPLAGFKRLFSSRSLVELGKGLLKLAVIGGVMAWLVMPMAPGIGGLVGLDPIAILGEVKGMLLRMIGGAMGVVTLIAAGDYLYHRFEFMRKMRMTKQEVKEEFKQSEGDPHIRGRLKQLRLERARRRMMAAVPKADVVITNPTHYAVAMKYEPEKMSAPVVVAKGADLIALAIRKLAEEHDVPIVESPPLARALYASVEVDREIPTEHYRAVAEIISYVFQLKGRVVRN